MPSSQPAPARGGVPAVTVVIPTRGLRERSDSLLRAVASVRDQAEVHAVAVVVLNGAQWAPEVEAALRSQSGVRVIARDRACLPGALHAGRLAVETPWFATLDDDDVLLPGALALRLQALDASPAIDVVVTNGIVRQGAGDRWHVPSDEPVGVDPLRALARRNWLLPGSWLARTDRIAASIFEGMPRYLECTYLALRFAIEHRMLWLPEPSVVYHVGSPHSESRSPGYRTGQPSALRSILALPLPSLIRRHLQRQLAVAHHDVAEFEWATGDLGEAWRHHLRSLATPGGLHYLPFTRHLLGSSVRRALGGDMRGGR